jgi:hypothetical protein
MGTPLITRLHRAQRLDLALQYRAQGMTYDAIALRMGDWSSGNALCRAISRHVRTRPSPELERIRADSEARLAEVIRQGFAAIRDLHDAGYTPATIHRLTPPIWDSITRADTELRRLMGANKPDKLSVEVSSADDADIERLVAEIYAQGRADAEAAREPVPPAPLALPAGSGPDSAEWSP